MNLFHRYIVREHVAPFVFAFTVIMFVLILKLMLQLMDLLITKGVGLLVMSKLLLYNLAWMIALVVPMSVLVATVMAFGRMGASGEIVAMKAAGISMYRLLSPVFLLGLLITFGMIYFNNQILPEANFRAGSLQRAIFINKPMLSLKNREGKFVTDSNIPFTLRFREMNEFTKEILGVTLFRQEERNTQTIITAESGMFLPGKESLSIILYNGEIHRKIPGQPERYVRNSFEQFRYVIKNLNFGLDTSYKSSRGDRNMTSDLMRERIKELGMISASLERTISNINDFKQGREAEIRNYRHHIDTNNREIARFLVEIHKKNSIPFAALVFVLIGASLGILVRRSGASIGIGLSIGFFMLYYLFLIGGESIGDRMMVAPWLAMWLPNIVLGGLGVGLFVYAARR
ncbi:hypothetical protein ES708_14593 [subsurface metagenome]